MAHTYDLLLQAQEPGGAPPIPAFVEALLARGAKVSPEGNGSWKLPAGEVSVSVLIEEGAPRGLDVRVPMKDTTTLVEEVARELVELAEATKGRVTDPQRGATVSLTNFAAMVDEYLRVARYAGEYGADSGAIGLTSYAKPLDDDSTSLRWLLAVGVFIAAIWISWKTINAVQEATLGGDAPATLDGATKLPGK